MLGHGPSDVQDIIHLCLFCICSLFPYLGFETSCILPPLLLVEILLRSIYYADKEPGLHDAFAKDRNALQLQMFNDVLPWVVSIALNRDTTGQKLTAQDMAYLEEKGIAKRWVGRRAVTYDGFPTLGRLYHQGRIVANARVTTHLGSGGGSFSHVASLISSFSLSPKEVQAELDRANLDLSFVQEVLEYADSRRKAMAVDLPPAA